MNEGSGEMKIAGLGIACFGVIIFLNPNTHNDVIAGGIIAVIGVAILVVGMLQGRC